jgi:hypothetical protein
MTNQHRPHPDTQRFEGPETEQTSSAIPNLQQTRVTKHPHTIEEDALPPGADDPRPQS